MSRHIVEDKEANRKFVYGWDQGLLTFFLQVHDLNRDEDEQIVEWYGTRLREIYEVEGLARVARRHGLILGHEERVKLYGEKDDGR